jgi:hypothetical protein
MRFFRWSLAYPRDLKWQGCARQNRPEGCAWVETRMRGDQQIGDGPPADMPSAILYGRNTGGVRRVPAVGMYCLAEIVTGMRKIHFLNAVT